MNNENDPFYNGAYAFNMVYDGERIDFLVGYDDTSETIAININGDRTTLDQYVVRNLIVALTELSKKFPEVVPPDEFQPKYLGFGVWRNVPKDSNSLCSYEQSSNTHYLPEQDLQRLARVERRMSKLEDQIDNLNDTLEEVTADLIEMKKATNRECRELNTGDEDLNDTLNAWMDTIENELEYWMENIEDQLGPCVKPDSPPTINWANIAALRGVEDILSHPDHLPPSEIERLNDLRDALRKVKE